MFGRRGRRAEPVGRRDARLAEDVSCDLAGIDLGALTSEDLRTSHAAPRSTATARRRNRQHTCWQSSTSAVRPTGAQVYPPRSGSPTEQAYPQASPDAVWSSRSSSPPSPRSTQHAPPGGAVPRGAVDRPPGSVGVHVRRREWRSARAGDTLVRKPVASASLSLWAFGGRLMLKCEARRARVGGMLAVVGLLGLIGAACVPEVPPPTTSTKTSTTSTHAAGAGAVVHVRAHQHRPWRIVPR